MAGVVKFEGQSPFLLPEAKSAQADVFEKSVVVTLYSEVEGWVGSRIPCAQTG
jgi:hypothetical protein